MLNQRGELLRSALRDPSRFSGLVLGPDRSIRGDKRAMKRPTEPTTPLKQFVSHTPDQEALYDCNRPLVASGNLGLEVVGRLTATGAKSAVVPVQDGSNQQVLLTAEEHRGLVLRLRHGSTGQGSRGGSDRSSVLANRQYGEGLPRLPDGQGKSQGGSLTSTRKRPRRLKSWSPPARRTSR
jgi:hypothetical protein